MTDFLMMVRHFYKKNIPDDRKEMFDRLPNIKNPMVFSVESGEIDQEEIDLMQAAWEENAIELPPEKDDNFWESCAFSDPSSDKEEGHLCFTRISGSLKRVESYRKFPKTVELLQTAKRMLTDMDIPFSDKDHCIEFHHTKVSENGMAVPKFHWHIDDGGPVNFNTIAVLFYLHKDKDMIGGNLFWNPDGEHEGGKRLINIETGTTIIMPGNTPHCPEIIQHNPLGDLAQQERKLIVFFFRDLTRT